MSVDTLFDYLESAEGSKDLDAFVSGSISPWQVVKLAREHEIGNRAESFLHRLSSHFYLQSKRAARASDAR